MLEAALSGGPVAAFQFRVKGVDQHEAARLAKPLQAICAAREVAFIVNDSVALAKEYDIPILQSAKKTTVFPLQAITYLSRQLAPHETRHGEDHQDADVEQIRTPH